MVAGYLEGQLVYALPVTTLQTLMYVTHIYILDVMYVNEVCRG